MSDIKHYAFVIGCLFACYAYGVKKPVIVLKDLQNKGFLIELKSKRKNLSEVTYSDLVEFAKKKGLVRQDAQEVLIYTLFFGGGLQQYVDVTEFYKKR